MLNWCPSAIIVLLGLATVLGCCHCQSILKNASCPPWTTPAITSGQFECKCFDAQFQNVHDGIIACDPYTKSLSVLACHCLTYNNYSEGGKLQVAPCLLNCANETASGGPGDIYHKILDFNDRNFETLNHRVCARSGNVPLNRDCRLCGACRNGTYPQAYSFNMTCVKCPEGNKNLWKYFLYSLGPLTVFNLELLCLFGDLLGIFSHSLEGTGIFVHL